MENKPATTPQVKPQQDAAAAPQSVGRRAFFGAAAGAVSAGLLPVAAAQNAPVCPAGGSVAWTQPSNNNGIIAQQQKGESAASRPAKLRSRALRLSPQTLTVAQRSKRLLGRLVSRIFLWTLGFRRNFDHDATAPLLDRMVGEFRLPMSNYGHATRLRCPRLVQVDLHEFGQKACPPQPPPYGHGDVCRPGGMRNNRQMSPRRLPRGRCSHSAG